MPYEYDDIEINDIEIGEIEWGATKNENIQTIINAINGVGNQLVITDASISAVEVGLTDHTETVADAHPATAINLSEEEFNGLNVEVVMTSVRNRLLLDIEIPDIDEEETEIVYNPAILGVFQLKITIPSTETDKIDFIELGGYIFYLITFRDNIGNIRSSISRILKNPVENDGDYIFTAYVPYREKDYDIAFAVGFAIAGRNEFEIYSYVTEEAIILTPYSPVDLDDVDYKTLAEKVVEKLQVVQDIQEILVHDEENDIDVNVSFVKSSKIAIKT